MAACLLGCGFHGSPPLGLCSSCERSYLALPDSQRPDLTAKRADALASAETSAKDVTAQRRQRVESIQRFVDTKGSAFARGKQVGEALRERILALHAAAPAVFPTGHDMEKWDAVAAAGLAAARIWTPVAVREMEGMASVGGGVDMGVVSRLAVLYEMVRIPQPCSAGGGGDAASVLAAWDALQAGGIYRASNDGGGGENPSLPSSWASGDPSAHLQAAPDECTSFAVHVTGQIIAGQTNDEPCHLFDGGNADAVVRYVDTGEESAATKNKDGEGDDIPRLLPTALTVTHPGMLAFKGMNSAGLVLCTNAIDNGERQLFGGVPRTCLARELLTKRTLAEAVELLEAAPRSIPLLYFFSQPGMGSTVIESAPSKLIIKSHPYPDGEEPNRAPRDGAVIAHGNVIRWLGNGNAAAAAARSKSDKKREALCAALLGQLAHERHPSRVSMLSQEAAMAALATKPVFVPGGTLEMFVVDPHQLSMRVRFMTDTVSGGGVDFDVSEDGGADVTFNCCPRDVEDEGDAASASGESGERDVMFEFSVEIQIFHKGDIGGNGDLGATGGHGICCLQVNSETTCAELLDLFSADVQQKNAANPGWYPNVRQRPDPGAPPRELFLMQTRPCRKMVRCTAVAESQTLVEAGFAKGTDGVAAKLVQMIPIYRNVQTF